MDESDEFDCREWPLCVGHYVKILLPLIVKNIKSVMWDI